MRAKRRVLLALALTLLTGMRDPFAPQPDPCHIAQLSLWRYQGFIVVNQRAKGIVVDAEGKWRRAGINAVFPTGWRVGEITQQEMQIFTAAGCEPQQWRWKREGNQHEAMDSGGARKQRAGRKSGSGEAGDAGGG